ncbi:MAG TPA: TrkA family potassium uptake protein [Vicinamibacteria bacterium]|nr:TrkA family potassium uptake protein [Vicinamibacteria bacterium]
MRKQVIVIGLGQFGMALAKALSGRKVEVLAIDRDPSRVRAAAPFVEEAVSFDATDNEALARTSPEKRDVTVCAIGDESRESSIICTALLRQMGSPRIVARANDEVHSRILRLVGAHEVVNPEREYGERLANHMVYREVMGELPFGKDLVLTELQTPPSFHEKSLSELALPRRFGIQIVGIRRDGESTVSLPEPKETLRKGDILVVVSREGAVTRLLEQET